MRMIRGAICQSFKFFVVVFTLVGATFTANCQAERNPMTLECRSVNQDAIGATALHQLKLIERDRQRGEKLWSEFSLFATEQASAAKRRLTSLGLQKWWQPSAPSVSPALQQHPAENTSPDTIGPVAMMTRLVANMSALQWIEVSNFGSDLIDSGSRRMTDAKNRKYFKTCYPQLAQISRSRWTTTKTCPPILIGTTTLTAISGRLCSPKRTMSSESARLNVATLA